MIVWWRVGEGRILIILAAGKGLVYVRCSVTVLGRKCWAGYLGSQESHVAARVRYFGLLHIKGFLFFGGF